jgi:hypothetical protein
MPRIVLFLLLILLALGLTLAVSHGSAVEGQPPLLETRVPLFEFHGRRQTRGNIGTKLPGDLPEAALALAAHTGIRIGIEALPPQRSSASVLAEVSAKDQTVQQVLTQMVRQDPRYQYRERLGVIEVLPILADKDPDDCLNMVIPAFHLHYPWRIAWGQIRWEIDIISRDPNDVVPDPLMERGDSGGSHMSNPPATILNLTFDRRTVRDILDVMSSTAGNAAWSASFRLAPATCTNLELAEYQPKAEYLGKAPNTWVAWPSPKCVACHYHASQNR